MADLLTTSQVQELLHVDRTTIYRMVEDGRMPAIRVGKQWRFAREELERWLQTQAAPLSSALPAVETPRASAATASAHLSEILPMPCAQLIQDAFAEMLGVMLVITDMDGQPVTQISNPCGFYVAATRDHDSAPACVRTWQRLAGSVSLEPRFMPSELGLLCARGLIRLGSELKGMVVLGGIAPEVWPPSPEELARMAAEMGVEPACLEANAGAVYRMEKAERDRTLRFVQRMADVFSHMAEDRSVIHGKLRAIASLTSL